MREMLRGKVAIVTGAGAGIGKAIATTLAAQGMHMVLMGRTPQKLEDTQKEILAQQTGAKTLVLAGDLMQEAYIKDSVSKAVAQFGGVDVLVNNAGIGGAKPVIEATSDEFDAFMKTNVRAPFLLCKYTLPYLKQSSYATICNIGSVVSYEGYENQALYAASKHALYGFHKAFAKETHSYGIRMHFIAPGGVYTEMVSKTRPDLDPTGLIVPKDIADTLLFLLQNRGNAVIDEIRIRREGKTPYC